VRLAGNGIRAAIKEHLTTFGLLIQLVIAGLVSFRVIGADLGYIPPIAVLDAMPFWCRSGIHMLLSAAVIAPIAILLKRPWGYLVQAPVVGMFFLAMSMATLVGQQSSGHMFIWLIFIRPAFWSWDCFRKGLKAVRAERLAIQAELARS
jgi:hypothetical protein